MILPNPTEKMTKSGEYRVIGQLIQRLYQSGVIRMGSGWCMSMSDMIYTMLKQQGIESRLVECQLTITRRDQDGEIWPVTVGMPAETRPENYADTHIVVVTVTEPPMIIDSSISHHLDGDGAVIVAECLEIARYDRVFANLVVDTVRGQISMTYQEKSKPIMPLVHQTSVIDRITTDRKIFDSIQTLKRLNYIGITLSMFAVINVVGKMLGLF